MSGQKKKHIAIYFPPHARFERYDVIVIVWDKLGRRQNIGYQLKEGGALPKSGTNRKFTSSYVIRGDSAEGVSRSGS